MHTIDQRIIIPAPADRVWEYVSDLTRNAKWQSDCTNVQFVTPRHEGEGVRWRATTARGREWVGEITTWHHRIGYEYHWIDGAPYRDNSGRVRLQETPDGTVVQWTFSYEMDGVFGGVRNSLSMGRHLDNAMAESLRTLYSEVRKIAVGDRFEAKSLMRDAPDADARAQYKPRHPSAVDQPIGSGIASSPRVVMPIPLMDAEPPIEAGDAEPVQTIIIPEPPIEQDDTRPTKTMNAVQPDATPARESATAEPSFLSDLPSARSIMVEPQIALDDTRPTTTMKAIQPGMETPVEAERPRPATSTTTSSASEPHAATIAARETSTPTNIDARSIWEILGIPRPAETVDIPVDASAAPLSDKPTPPEAPVKTVVADPITTINARPQPSMPSPPAFQRRLQITLPTIFARDSSVTPSPFTQVDGLKIRLRRAGLRIHHGKSN